MIDVGAPRRVEHGDCVSLRYPLRAPAWVGLHGGELALTYPAAQSPAQGEADAAVMSLLPFAYWAGAHLRLDPALALSPAVRHNAARLCRVWGEWYRRPFALKILGRGAEPGLSAAPGRTALFFSGGVDSMATFLRHRDQIDSLVFVRGSDLYLRPERLDVAAKFQSIEVPLRRFAEAAGKEFFVLATNVRRLFGFRFRGEIWVHVGHGCATVAPAYPLADRYPRWLISSSGSGRYERTFLTGTHPDLVPHLGTPRLSVAMPDTHLGRHERLCLIASEPGALAVLRVCSTETPLYNCGQCKKCYQAIASLLVAGVAPGAAPFPIEAFTFEHVARLAQGGPLPFKGSVYWGEILAALDEAANLPPAGRRLADILRARLPFQPRYLQGAPPEATERLYPDLPARPNAVHRLIGFPALNHGSFSKWLKQRLRDRASRLRPHALRTAAAAGPPDHLPGNTP